MGRYRVPKRTVTLNFEGEYEGAQVVCRLDVPMQTFFDLQKAVATKPEDLDPSQVEDTYRRFAKEVLIDWNLEGDDEQQIPATPDGFLMQPLAFTATIIREWSKAVADVPAPLDGPSMNGAELAPSSTPLPG